MGNLGGWIQVLAGLFGIAQQMYQIFSGLPIDVTHSAIAAGLLSGGVAHISNGRNGTGKV